MKDNEYILTGFRRQSNSYLWSIKPILALHNETGNIWSHLVGALLFAWSLRSFHCSVWPPISSAELGNTIAVTVYYVGVVNCFVLSTTYHTPSNHPKEVYKFCNQLGHLGVVLVIHGPTMPGTFFAFYCHPDFRTFYWFLSTLFAIASTVFTLRPKFRQPTYRRARLYMYSFLGASAFFPIVHGTSSMGIRKSTGACR